MGEVKQKTLRNIVLSSLVPINYSLVVYTVLRAGLANLKNIAQMGVNTHIKFVNHPYLFTKT
jgi:hypothetical protein